MRTTFPVLEVGASQRLHCLERACQYLSKGALGVKPATTESPSRADTDLRLSDVPVDSLEPSHTGLEPPTGGQVTAPPPESHWNGIGHVPENVRERAAPSGEDDILELLQRNSPAMFVKGPPKKDNDEYNRILKVSEATSDGRNEYFAEADWNSAVQYPLLKLASTGYRRQQIVRLHHQCLDPGFCLLPHFSTVGKFKARCRLRFGDPGFGRHG